MLEAASKIVSVQMILDAEKSGRIGQGYPRKPTLALGHRPCSDCPSPWLSDDLDHA